jgi:hypothetical protein
MTYTIKIDATESELARNLLRYLKSLTQTKEYEFLQVIEDDENPFSEDQKTELDLRYEHFLQHQHEYPDWEDVKEKYVKA